MEAEGCHTRLFNARPLVRIALGFCLGIAFDQICKGTWVLWLVCLLCALAAWLLFQRRYRLLSFTLAILYGMLRMRLSYMLDASALQALLSPIAGALSALRSRLLSITDLLFYDAAPLLRGVLWGDTTYICPYFRFDGQEINRYNGKE